MVINLALGKPTKMSSIYNNSASWKGVDGEREPKHTCAVTGSDQEAWWQVDLEAVYVIRVVVVYSRKRELQCITGLV